MNLSKSRYCNAYQCLKMLWLDVNHPELKSDVSNSSVLENGTEVGILAKGLFGEYIDIPFSNNLSEMINNTQEVILKNKNAIICEASFVYNNNFCSVDILKKNNDEYEIYEVKSSTEIKDIYLEDISYQTYVLKNLGLNVVKSSIVYINHFYERVGDLNLHNLFKIKNVTDLVNQKQNEVKKYIDKINLYMNEINEPIKKIGLHCVKPYDCPFFKYCTKDLPDKNIFELRRMKNSTKFKYYDKGIYKYEDLLKEKIDDKVREQIEFELYNKADKINKTEIKDFLNTLSYPLYFLDFETYQQSIPMFDYVHPYEQIPFQYSIHILRSDTSLPEHIEFLADSGKDPRKSLAERLIRDIPKDVCVLAYNMSFEKSVIKRLAKLYPDLEESLMNIHDNIKDLMIPFYNHDYYSKNMYGSYSIKYVLPSLFPNDKELDYHNLDGIHNGSEAMNSFKELDNLPMEEQQKVRHNLLKYCELDTYAMVKIYKKLKKI